MALRIVVSGRVQGVGFRAWTRREALRLGLRGSAVNLLDGRVEIMAEGDAAGLDALVDVLRNGAGPGSVSDVEVAEIDPFGAVGFDVG